MGRKMIRMAAVAACTMFLFAGVALAADIKVGHLADLTGPTSSVGNPYAKGVQDYKNYVNAHGGINGKQIDMQMFDYAYDKNKAVNQYKKYVEEKVIAIQGWGTGDTEALTGFLAADKIPYLSASYSPNLTDPKERSVQLLHRGGLHHPAAGGLEVHQGQLEGEAGPQARIHLPEPPVRDRPDQGREGVCQGIGFVGFEELGDEEVGLKAIEANSQMLSVKNKGADFGWIGGTTPSAAVIIKDAKKLGLKTKFLVNVWGNDEDLIKIAGDAADGVLGLQAAAVYGDKVPGMKLIQEVTKNEHQNTHYIRGWVSMMVLCEALKIADKKGQLNGPGVKDALETLKDFDTGGLTSKITFTPTDHRPNMSAKIYEYQKGKLVYKTTIELPRKAEWLGL